MAKPISKIRPSTLYFYMTILLQFNQLVIDYKQNKLIVGSSLGI